MSRGRLKHRWSLGHNYLAGITAGDWYRLLRENRFSVSPAYLHRAVFITLTSLANSYYSRREDRAFRESIERVPLDKPPLFILGHWRSGTTLLHYLLALDQQQFTFANTYQVVNPKTFLTTEQTMTRRFSWMVPPKRPMDDMKLSFDAPQEDEFAPLLTTLCSPYLGISFPKHFDRYARYLTFRGATEDERSKWKSEFLWFCKKLSLKKDASLLLKSPPHTARIAMLLELFPDARFVHIHRNPYEVFQSQRHFFDTAIWYTYLQKPDLDAIDDGILSRYREMYDAYFDDVGRIPDDRICEIRFTDLESDPVGVIEKVYDDLALKGIDALRPQLESYVLSLSGYRRNRFEPLDESTRNRVATEWQRNFHAWGYEP